MDGRSNRFTILRDGQEIMLSSKPIVELRRGDRLSIFIGGAGGYGDPKSRPYSDVLRDYREDRVSRECAEKIFGVTIPDREEGY